jgi:hypothetical protein
MATPKFSKQTIKVYCVETQAKTLEVEAQVLGDYAVNEGTNAHSIALTHIPSGMCIWSFDLATTCGVGTMGELKKQVRATAILCHALPTITLPDLADKTAWRQGNFLQPWQEIVRKARREKIFN